MQSFLVTGGCGFIGSHLVDNLIDEGFYVRVLDDLSTGTLKNLNPRATFIQGDVADPMAVARAMEGVDGCFHLAAVSSVVRANEDWLGTHHTNQTGSVAVFNAARTLDGRASIPVVYASSAAVYGNAPFTPIPESAPLAAETAYGADKLGSELHARVAWRVHGVPTIGLRFFNVYGPRQNAKSDYSGVISVFLHRLMAQKPISLYGDGSRIRDFIHVDDVVQHLRAAMDIKSKDCLVMNVCTGRGTSIAELLNYLSEILGMDPKIVHAPERKGDIQISVGDPSLAEKKLKLAAKKPLMDGLVNLAAYVSRNGLSDFDVTAQTARTQIKGD